MNRSYKEVCAPVLERCHFLFSELRPAMATDICIKTSTSGLANPRWKHAIQSVLAGIKTDKGRFTEL